MLLKQRKARQEGLQRLMSLFWSIFQGKNEKIKKQLNLQYQKVAEMMKLMEMKRALKSNKELLRQQYGVKEIGIFGSFARGEQKKKSDVDVLVEFEDMPDLIKFIELERKLQRLLGKKVDLVRKGAIREELKDSILRDVKIV